MTNKGVPVVRRSERIKAIVKLLPAKFNDNLLRQVIRSVDIRGATVNNRQTEDSYVNEMQARDWIREQPPGRYRLSPLVIEGGEIRIRVKHAILIPEILETLKNTISTDDITSIEEVV